MAITALREGCPEFGQPWSPSFEAAAEIMLVLGAAGGSPALDYKNELNQWESQSG